MSTVKKNIRKNQENRTRNIHYSSCLRTLRKKVLKAISEKEAQTLSLRDSFNTLLKRMANKGIIHLNKMARYQSRISKKIKNSMERL